MSLSAHVIGSRRERSGGSGSYKGILEREIEILGCIYMPGFWK
jgi:hypothetical protein